MHKSGRGAIEQLGPAGGVGNLQALYIYKSSEMITRPSRYPELQ